MPPLPKPPPPPPTELCPLRLINSVGEYKEEEKLGRRAEIFPFCLEKNPFFLVENDGYPLTSSLFAFADAHDIPLGPNVDDDVVGENIPLLGVDAPLPVDVRLGLDRDHPVPPINGGDDRS